MENNKQILIVEDEVIIALQVKDALSQMGHSIAAICASGEEALVGLKTVRPDLVLMDIKLQGELDGIETAELINKQYDIPIIYMTAHSEESTIERAKITEPYGYLPKPVDVNNLRTAVEVALYKHSFDRKLREREEHYRSLAENMGDVIWKYNISAGRFTFVSASVQKMRGFTPWQAMQQSMEETLSPESYKLFFEELRSRLNAFMSGDHFSTQIQTQYLDQTHQNGSLVPTEVVMTLLLNEEGLPIELLGVSRDITERKRAEEEIRELNKSLENRVVERTAELVATVAALNKEIDSRAKAEQALTESEERYRHITESLTDYIYTVKIENGRPVETVHGPGCIAVTGYTSEEFERQPLLWIGMVAPEDRHLVKDQAICILNDKGPCPLEHRIIHKDGTVKWVRNTAVPRLNEHGELIAYDGLVQDITEKKKAEERLRAEYAFESAVISSASEGICVCHEVPEYPHVKFTVWNNRMTEITGYTMEEINLTGWYQTVYPDPDSQTRAAERMACMRHGDNLKAEEWEIKRSDGTKRTISISTSIISVSANDHHVLALMNDVTERKEKEEELRKYRSQLEELVQERTIELRLEIEAHREDEEALRESEEYFRSMAEVSEAIIYRLSASGEVLYVSPAIFRQLGLEPEAAIGRHFLDFVMPHNHARAKKAFETLLSGSYVRGLDLELRHVDGTTFWGNISVAPIIHDGKVHQHQGIIIDITDRKRTEEALERSERTFKNIFEGSADGIIIADPKVKRIVLANRKMADILGYEIEELRNISVSDLHDPAYLPEVFKIWADLSACDTVCVDAVAFKRKDGSKVYLEATVFTITMDGNEILGGSFRDISERKKVETERALNEQRLQALLGLNNLLDAEQGRIIDYVLDAALITVQSQFAFIGLMDETEAVMTIHKWSEDVMAQCAVDRTPMQFTIADTGLLGECVRQGTPVLINDYDAFHPSKKGCPAGHVAIRRFLGIPVFDGNRIVAVAAAANKAEEYTKSDVNALTALTERMWGIIRRQRAEQTIALLNRDLELRVEDRTSELRREIEDHKKDSVALEESEFRYRRLLESITNYVYTVSVKDGRPEATVHYPNCEALSGFKPEDYTADPNLWYRMVHEEDRQRVLDTIQRIFVEKSPITFEHRLLHKTGKVKWVKNTLVPHLDDMGELVSYDGILRDITGRKAAETALNYRNLLLATHQEVSIDGFLFVNENREIVLYNSRFAEMWGIPSDIIASRSDEQAIQSVISKLQDPEAFNTLVNYIYEHNPEARRMDEIALKDGRTFERNTSPMYGEDGTYYGRVWYFRDITERKQLEEQLREIAETLEVRVRERTRALEDANNELKLLNMELDLRRQEAEEAKIRADAATHAKSEFLANMSHELRTPLNSIIGFSDILHMEIVGGLNERQKENIGFISSSGKHLLQLINEILDLSKVEAGKIDLELATVSLRDMVQSSMKLLTEKAYKNGLRIEAKIAPATADTINADPLRLKQILYNLLSNAVKFTPEGGKITLRVRNAGKEHIEISVEDTGIGIKQEDIPKLFKEFVQLESPYHKKYEGTGLGLALTRRLVELHGGNIRVESEFGKGSKFIFVLPVMQVTPERNP